MQITGSLRRPSIAAAAAHSGRDEIAAKAAQRILALYPEFEAEALANFERWRFEAQYYEVFVGGLKGAGLALRHHAVPAVLRRLVRDEQVTRKDHHRARAATGSCLDIEHGVEGSQALVDAP